MARWTGALSRKRIVSGNARCPVTPDEANFRTRLAFPKLALGRRSTATLHARARTGTSPSLELLDAARVPRPLTQPKPQFAAIAPAFETAKLNSRLAPATVTLIVSLSTREKLIETLLSKGVLSE